MTLDKLRKYCQQNKGKPTTTVVVGYSQSYATEVHERTDISHKVGQSKYLETAARSNENEIRNTLRKSPKDKLAENMLKAGLLIQRESQQLVPVDTSALKASAFTCVEEELDQVANAARSKAELLRLSVLAQRAAKGKQ